MTKQFKPTIKRRIRHPGEIFKQQFIVRYNLKIQDAANKLHINRVQLSRFLNGHDAVTVTLARKLEVATNVSAEYWLNRQARFNLQEAQRQQYEVQAESLFG